MEVNYRDYDKVIVYFSGGKDSWAALLKVLEAGITPEIWHHDIDGREGGVLKMDWEVTPDYCRQSALAVNAPIYFSWKVGGFARELFRENARTAPIRFETPGGEVREVGGTGGKLSTRRQFPQVSANLRVRWCSAYLKIDVAAAAIRGRPDLQGQRILTISGERRAESPARSKYAEFEPDRTNNSKRHVDRYRAVIDYSEADVWAALKNAHINPHPAYWLGWSRCSCKNCIFGNPDQWASCRAIDRTGFEQISELEIKFGKTIHRSHSVIELADKGTAYPATQNLYWVAIARSNQYDLPIIVDDWQLPSGAFGDGCGPT